METPIFGQRQLLLVTILPEALASVPFGFALVRVRVRAMETPIFGQRQLLLKLASSSRV